MPTEPTGLQAFVPPVEGLDFTVPLALSHIPAADSPASALFSLHRAASQVPVRHVTFHSHCLVLGSESERALNQECLPPSHHPSQHTLLQK